MKWALVSVGASLLLVTPFLIMFGPDWFLHLGEEHPASIDLAGRVVGPDVDVPHQIGHDGKSFWVLARDPFLLRDSELRTTLDYPIYRARRIAYPLLAAPWRLGGEHSLLWGMLVTNMAIVVAGAYVSALLASRLGGPGRASLAFTLSPAVLVALLFDLSDALFIAAILLAVFLVHQGKTSSASWAGALAALAREHALLVMAALAFLPGKLRGRERVELVVVPVAVFASWEFYVRWRLGEAGQMPVAFARPFGGFLDLLRLGSLEGDWGAIGLGFIILPIAAIAVIRWYRTRSILMDAALPIALTVPFLSVTVLDVAVNSFRIIGPVVTLLVLDYYSRN